MYVKGQVFHAPLSVASTLDAPRSLGWVSLKLRYVKVCVAAVRTSSLITIVSLGWCLLTHLEWGEWGRGKPEHRPRSSISLPHFPGHWVGATHLVYMASLLTGLR